MITIVFWTTGLRIAQFSLVNKRAELDAAMHPKCEMAAGILLSGYKRYLGTTLQPIRLRENSQGLWELPATLAALLRWKCSYHIFGIGLMYQLPERDKQLYYMCIVVCFPILQTLKVEIVCRNLQVSKGWIKELVGEPKTIIQFLVLLNANIPSCFDCRPPTLGFDNIFGIASEWHRIDDWRAEGKDSMDTSWSEATANPIPPIETKVDKRGIQVWMQCGEWGCILGKENKVTKRVIYPLGLMNGLGYASSKQAKVTLGVFSNGSSSPTSTQTSKTRGHLTQAVITDPRCMHDRLVGQTNSINRANSEFYSPTLMLAVL